MRSIFARSRVSAWPLVVFCGLLVALLGSSSVARASSSCSNELFRTGPGSNLPDCRAYEMVSPPEKNGGEVDNSPTLEGTPPNPEQAALSGEAVTYGSTTAFTEANPESAPVTSQYISRRSATGWRTEAITPPQKEPGGVLNREQGAVDFSLYQGFTEDLSHAFLQAYEPYPVPGAPEKYYAPFVRDDSNGSYSLLSTVKPPVQIPGISDQGHGLRIEYAGMSADGSHVVFSANDALTPGAIPGKYNLYESSNGKLELVSVLPNGEAVGGENYGGGGATFGRVEYDQGGLNEAYDHVISPDGSRVFFSVDTTVPGELGPERERQAYMRELGPAGPRVVRIAASQKTNGSGSGGSDLNGTLPAVYRQASPDGNEVFFTSCEKLTNDSTAGPLSGSLSEVSRLCHGNVYSLNVSKDEDLYRYEPATGGLVDVSVDPHPGETASVISVLGASRDGSSVYFVARGALTAGAASEKEGVYNVYLWKAGTLTLVTTLHAFKTEASILVGLNADIEWDTAEVSPSGRYLAFESAAPLTGYETTPTTPGICDAAIPAWEGNSIGSNDTGHCTEMFEYDAESGKLTCASCDPRGLPPDGDSVSPMAIHSVAQYAGWQSTTVQQRFVLDDGRLFFDSKDSLLPQASNGRVNVFEYEPEGLGSCQRGGGCVALISSGTSSDDSYFADSSASGDDAFFLTRQELVAEDGDEAVDMYDARVDGGFPSAIPQPCSGEACRPPIASAPAIFGAPPSATFLGAGNPQPAVQGAPAKAKPTKKRAKPKKKAKPKRKAGRRAVKRRARVRKSSTRGRHR
jgi:hypothetical protein